MTRRITRSPVRLRPAKEALSSDELKTILRGADELIGSGGRTLLAKILKGSKDKKVLELGLEDSPVYGAFDEMSADAVHAKIDRVISEGYLSYEYSGRLPLLVYTDKGWEIERETYAEELFDKLRAMAEGGESAFDVATLKDRNRGMIMLLLDILEAQADERFIPLLQRWYDVEYKKVRQRIESVIRTIKTIPK
ncbi:MAG: RQC-minor-1 family DNA-binding protein [Ignavibacteria bacterium]|nr:RQC-minor-1 family DNA-binding protein [Ignavibacteria bacterium]